METEKPEISKPWFRAKKYGYGSGLPIAWQGWLVFLGYIFAVCGIPLILLYVFDSVFVYSLTTVLILIVSTIAVFKICKRKTAGGWKWRWGDK